MSAGSVDISFDPFTHPSGASWKELGAKTFAEYVRQCHDTDENERQRTNRHYDPDWQTVDSPPPRGLDTLRWCYDNHRKMLNPGEKFFIMDLDDPRQWQGISRTKPHRTEFQDWSAIGKALMGGLRFHNAEKRVDNRGKPYPGRGNIPMSKTGWCKLDDVRKGRNWAWKKMPGLFECRQVLATAQGRACVLVSRFEALSLCGYLLPP